MNAYEKLKEIKDTEVISEEFYNRMSIDFQAQYLASISYMEGLARHRKPTEFMYQVLKLINTLLLEIQSRPEMSHHEAKEYNYVPTKITEIWDSDNRLKSEYEAILIYCNLTGKNPNIILVQMAEYRAMQRLYEKINREILISNTSNQANPMAKNFETEIRETFDKQYLKIFLRHGLDYEAVSTHLTKLPSVRKSNVTVQQSGKVDLTVYPSKAYDIKETQEEVELTLDNYFKGNKVDPQFIDEPVSSVSEKAYYQVIDYMLDLGKNLEGSKRLTEKFDEERYRDYFIPYLNTISKKHSATAESFHSSGKTDILFLNEKGEPVLIAECKLWKGEKLLLEAIDQLLNTYVNWRDEKIALVVFNRDNKKFSEVIETAAKAVESHRLCLKDLGKRTTTSYSYLFRHPDDENRTIKLELVLFNFA
jgi:hypothetical protein